MYDERCLQLDPDFADFQFIHCEKCVVSPLPSSYYFNFFQGAVTVSTSSALSSTAPTGCTTVTTTINTSTFTCPPYPRIYYCRCPHCKGISNSKIGEVEEGLLEEYAAIEQAREEDREKLLVELEKWRPQGKIRKRERSRRLLSDADGPGEAAPAEEGRPGHPLQDVLQWRRFGERNIRKYVFFDESRSVRTRRSC